MQRVDFGGLELAWEGHGEVALTDASRHRIARWFMERGYRVLATDEGLDLADELKEQADRASFLAFFPPRLWKDLDDSLSASLSDDEVKRLATEMPAVDFLRAAGRATSLSLDRHAFHGHREGRLEAVLYELPATELASALEGVAGDPAAFRGIAWLFYATRIDMGRGMDPDLRARWLTRLGRVVLTDTDDDEIHGRALDRMRRLGTEEARALVADVESGRLRVRQPVPKP